MFHSDLRLEIAFLQAQLDYKRHKVAHGFQNNLAFKDMEQLYSEIREIEQKLQLCFEESNTQMERD
jgi:hypothetical protein